MIINKEEPKDLKGTTTRAVSMPSSTRSQRKHPS